MPCFPSLSRILKYVPGTFFRCAPILERVPYPSTSTCHDRACSWCERVCSRTLWASDTVMVFRVPGTWYLFFCTWYIVASATTSGAWYTDAHVCAQSSTALVRLGDQIICVTSLNVPGLAAIRPMPMVQRSCNKKFELQRYPPKSFRTRFLWAT